MQQLNPLAVQFINMMRNGANPQQLAISLLESQAEGNPMLQNLLAMAKSGNTQDIESVARNLLASQGLDFDKEFNSFRNNLGL